MHFWVGAFVVSITRSWCIRWRIETKRNKLLNLRCSCYTCNIRNLYIDILWWSFCTSFLKHDRIYNAALELRWNELPITEQKMYQLFIQKCQNPTLLTVAGLYPLNLDTCLMVCYFFFAFFQNSHWNLPFFTGFLKNLQHNHSYYYTIRLRIQNIILFFNSIIARLLLLIHK